jgi:cell division protein FtsQ
MNGTGKRGGHHRWPAALLLIVLVVILAGGAIKANRWKGDLRIAVVETRGEHILSKDEILALADIRIGGRLFGLDLPAVGKRIEQNRFVSSGAVNREVPDRIVITVAERQPVAAIAGQKLFYIDRSGVLLPPVRAEEALDLPLLTGTVLPADGGPGSRIASGPIAESVQLLAAADSVSDALYRRISEVHLEEGHDLLVYLSDAGVPVIFGHGNAYGQCVKLEAFWEQFVASRGVDDLEYVDLRFDGQVVARWRHGQDLAQD